MISNGGRKSLGLIEDETSSTASTGNANGIPLFAQIKLFELAAHSSMKMLRNIEKCYRFFGRAGPG